MSCEDAKPYCILDELFFNLEGHIMIEALRSKSHIYKFIYIYI